MMPTAAKLVAAIAFAAVGFLAAEAYKPGLTPDTQWGLFSIICAGIGFVCGWMISGARRKPGVIGAGGTGMRTAVTIAFWVLLLFSVRDMVLRSMKRQYDGVFDAVEGTFDIMLKYGEAVWRSFGTGDLRFEPLAVLLVGGFLAGV
ncbi:MAG: TrgA family protein, partial [Gemmobacter sp.]